MDFWNLFLFFRVKKHLIRIFLDSLNQINDNIL